MTRTVLVKANDERGNPVGGATITAWMPKTDGPIVARNTDGSLMLTDDQITGFPFKVQASIDQDGEILKSEIITVPDMQEVVTLEITGIPDPVPVPGPTPKPAIPPLLAFGVGVAFILIAFGAVIALGLEDPLERYLSLALFALGAGSFALGYAGHINAEIKIWEGLAIGAGGSFAVFILLIILFNYFEPDKSPQPSGGDTPPSATPEEPGE